MTKKLYKKVMFVGRATTFMVGLAVILALTVGLASTALAGTGVGAAFNLGQINTVNAISKLVGSVAGPSLIIDNDSTNSAATALNLKVEPGKAPMKVNSGAKVTNLNSDKVDGKSASEIGVNGLEYLVGGATHLNSDSPKTESVECPAGKMVVGTGYKISSGGYDGSFPNQEANVVIKAVDVRSTEVTVTAVEEEPTSLEWFVNPSVICATAP